MPGNSSRDTSKKLGEMLQQEPALPSSNPDSVRAVRSCERRFECLWAWGNHRLRPEMFKLLSLELGLGGGNGVGVRGSYHPLPISFHVSFHLQTKIFWYAPIKLERWRTNDLQVTFLPSSLWSSYSKCGPQMARHHLGVYYQCRHSGLSHPDLLYTSSRLSKIPKWFYMQWMLRAGLKHFSLSLCFRCSWLTLVLMQKYFTVRSQENYY